MKKIVVNLKENDPEYKYSDLKLASVASIVKNTGNVDKCPIAFFNTTITESYKVLFVYLNHTKSILNPYQVHTKSSVNIDFVWSKQNSKLSLTTV